MSTTRTVSRKNKYATYKLDVKKPFRKLITFAMYQKGVTQQKLMEELEVLSIQPTDYVVPDDQQTS